MEYVVKMTCKYCKNKVNNDYYYTGYSSLPTNLRDIKKYPGSRFSYDTNEDYRTRSFFCSRECYLVFINKERLKTHFFYFLLGLFYIFLIYCIGGFIFSESLIKGFMIFKNPFIYLGVIFIVIIIGHIILEYNRLLGYKEVFSLYNKNEPNQSL
jgi:hypothetical protein